MGRFREAMILDHVFDCQRLDADRLVFTDQACRELVQEITAAISNPGMKTSNLLACLVSVLRSLFLLGMSSLCFRQLFLIFGKEFGIAHDFTRRQGDELLQSQKGYLATLLL